MKTTVAGDKNKTVLDTAIENDIDAPLWSKRVSDFVSVNYRE